MTRSERLLKLVQLLRRQRLAISAAQLADTLGISMRTVYRDIDALRAQGARIEGESGVGYVLRQDFLLPALTLTVTSVSRWPSSSSGSPKPWARA